MKINKIYRLIALLFFAMLFCVSLNAQKNNIEVSSTIVDEQGNPLNDVKIYGPKGAESSTNKNGEFKISILSDDTVIIKKKGYESKLITINNIQNSITLTKSIFLASEDDEIMMGVGTKKQRDIVGAVSSTRPKERLTYDNTQFILNYINGLTVGVRGGSNIRGLGGALFVIDGVFGRNPNLLNMEEVEQITVLRDANAVALYGSQARDGVIVINTRRGKINQREINVNIRSGFRQAISTPNYLDAASFMELRDEARINDGVDPTDLSLFRNQPDNPILRTREGTNPVAYPDVDLYDFVQPTVNTTSVVSEFSGGNTKSQYYVNMGWNFSEDWVNINPDINAGSNRFNVRGNIDFKVNDWISSSVDGVFIVAVNRGPRSNLFREATNFIPFDYAPLIPLSSLPNTPEITQLLSGAQVFNGNLLGTVQQVGLNPPVALSIAGGRRDNVVRGTQFNNTVNFDLSAITEGLSAKTYLSFDFLDSYTTSISNQFRTYAPVFDQNREITDLQDFGQDLRSLSENVTSNGFVSRLGFYGLVNYNKEIVKNHSINTTFLGFFNSQQSTARIQTDKDAHLGFQMTYDYKKKLYVDFSGAYIHSIKLPDATRNALSPTVGLAYILSEEDFFKEIDFVNYFKVRATGGIIKSDSGFGYFLFDENYSGGASFTWADGLQSNRRQSISQGANPNLGFEERIDFNLGFESYLFNSLWLEANYFRSERADQLTTLADQFPSYYSTFRPINNFNANLNTGFEVGVNFNKTVKDFTLGIGANLLYTQTEALRRSETNEFDYQNRQGRELSTIFGLESLGFYQESDFTTNIDGELVLNSDLPVPNFGQVRPGDLRYKDQNGDNIIDQDDNIGIGQRSSPLTYGVNLNLKYKDFSLFILGTGQTAGLGSKLDGGFNDYYAPNGNDKYSEVVLGRWTPETANTATFPRLSSNNNPNNFRTSSFWLYNNAFFSIDRAQLTYEFNDALCNIIGVKDFSFNLQGTNLVEFAENRDIRELRIGSAPLSRTYTFGVRVSF